MRNKQQFIGTYDNEESDMISQRSKALAIIRCVEY